METFQHLKTIFHDGQIITTDPATYIGKTLLKPIVKTWTEDFVDEDTGEVVAIERSEILMQAGTRLTNDTIAQIRFFMSEDSCTLVYLSTQQRSGFTEQHKYRQLYLYSIRCGEEKLTFYLAAGGDEMAVQIGHDFAEQVCKGYFYFDSLKRTNLVFVPLPEYAPEKDSEGQPIVRQFFQVVVSVKFAYNPKPTQARYLTYAKNADEASDTIRRFRNDIRAEAQKEAEDSIEEEKILKVSPIEVTYIVPEHFFQQYAEAEQSGFCVHNRQVLHFEK